MKKVKVLLAVSSIAVFALMGCGKRNKPSTPDGSSIAPTTSIPGGEDIVTPVNLDKVKENIKNLKTVTLTE